MAKNVGEVMILLNAENRVVMHIYETDQRNL